MNADATQAHDRSADEAAVRALHEAMWKNWNSRSAEGMAALCAVDANLIGFDGSMIDGRAAIESSMREIFAHHQTAAYVGIIREVRFLNDDVAVIRAVVGMVPPGGHDINPAVNAVQTLVAARAGAGWHIALYQNTPAQFHGRPELAEQLSTELRGLLSR